MVFNYIAEFFGAFHPVLVHLPIGFLLIGLLLQLLCTKGKYLSAKIIIAPVLLLGFFAALISCITGYLLSINDGFNSKNVDLHMWMGIGVAIISLLLYTKEIKPKLPINARFLALTLFIFLTITGHLGGSITHGSDYLTAPLKKFFSNTLDTFEAKPIVNIQEAVVYPEVIVPILKSKCYSCHNAGKQKGGLQMDDLSSLMKGGKNGKVIIAGDDLNSQLITRLLLPIDDDKHMPPKEKPQLTESQITLLQWWIKNHAETQKKVKDLQQPVKFKGILTALESTVSVKKNTDEFLLTPVKEGNKKAISQLQSKGIIIVPVMQNSNYLMVNFVAAQDVVLNDFDLLNKLKSQIIYLKLSNLIIDRKAYTYISKLNNLRYLNLSNTNITDDFLKNFNTIENLEYLNLTGTKITINGLMKLKGLKKLSSLYIYKTNFETKKLESLKRVFPNTKIDTGNYKVPTYSHDTTKIKFVK